MLPLFKRRSTFLILLVLLALTAAAISIYATWKGPLGFSDSAAYLSSGRNWARGLGLGVFQASGDFEALTVHPPLYALYYGVLQFLGIDLLDGGRALNALAAALTALALGLLFLRYSRAPWLGLLAAGLLLAFPTVIGAFAALMTDGIFLAIWLWGMLALFAYLERPGRRPLLAAILLFGALPLLRYIGLAFVIAGALILLLWLHGKWRQRLQQAAVFAAGALAPSLLWQLISYLSLEKGLAGRGLALGETDYSDSVNAFLLQVATILKGWNPFGSAAPSSPWPTLLILGALAALAAWAIFTWGRQSTTESYQIEEVQLFGAFGLTAIVFLGSVAGAYLFTLPRPDLIERTLLPLLVCLLVCTFSAVALLGARRPWAGYGLALAGSAILLLGLARPAYEFIQPLHEGREGYFTYAWRDSALIDAIQALPADQAIIASQPALTLYWADRPAFEMIPYLPPGFLASGDAYGSDPEDDRLQARFQAGAALVLFRDFPAWLYEDYGASLTQGLELLNQYPEGAIYVHPER